MWTRDKDNRLIPSDWFETVTDDAESTNWTVFLVGLLTVIGAAVLWNYAGGSVR